MKQELLALIQSLRTKAAKEGCSVLDINAFCDSAESLLKSEVSPKTENTKNVIAGLELE